MELLAARFARNGVVVWSAVPAFSGVYPWMDGRGNVESLFVRYRLLALTAAGIQEWSAWTGPTPMKLLRVDPRTDAQLVTGRRQYDKFVVAGRRFWLDSEYRWTVRSWIESDYFNQPER